MIQNSRKDNVEAELGGLGERRPSLIAFVFAMGLCAGRYCGSLYGGLRMPPESRAQTTRELLQSPSTPPHPANLITRNH